MFPFSSLLTTCLGKGPSLRGLDGSAVHSFDLGTTAPLSHPAAPPPMECGRLRASNAWRSRVAVLHLQRTFALICTLLRSLPGAPPPPLLIPVCFLPTRVAYRLQSACREKAPRFLTTMTLAPSLLLSQSIGIHKVLLVRMRRVERWALTSVSAALIGSWME